MWITKLIGKVFPADLGTFVTKLIGKGFPAGLGTFVTKLICVGLIKKVLSVFLNKHKEFEARHD